MKNNILKTIRELILEDQIKADGNILYFYYDNGNVKSKYILSEGEVNIYRKLKQ